MLNPRNIADPKTALRLHYQAMAYALGRSLEELAYEPLDPATLEPGQAEWAVTGTRTEVSPAIAQGFIRRTYLGYVGLHYALGTAPGQAAPDDARLAAALELFPNVAQANKAEIPGIQVISSDFGGDGDTLVNVLPENAAHPAVLSHYVEWSLTLDLSFSGGTP